LEAFHEAAKQVSKCSMLIVSFVAFCDQPFLVATTSSSQGVVEIVEKLLSEKQVNVDDPFVYNVTALHLACWNSHQNIVEKLLEYNATVDAK
jgi:ankyrin repeat protein